MTHRSALQACACNVSLRVLSPDLSVLSSTGKTSLASKYRPLPLYRMETVIHTVIIIVIQTII